MADAARSTNVAAMNNLKGGYDVVIVCTNNQQLADYWQERLTAARGQIVPRKTAVIGVCEDWPGGAGNALGTFYAYKKGCVVAKELYGMDLPALLASGSTSVALYHTAGVFVRG